MCSTFCFRFSFQLYIWSAKLLNDEFDIPPSNCVFLLNGRTFAEWIYVLAEKLCTGRKDAVSSSTAITIRQACTDQPCALICCTWSPPLRSLARCTKGRKGELVSAGTWDFGAKGVWSETKERAVRRKSAAMAEESRGEERAQQERMVA